MEDNSFFHLVISSGLYPISKPIEDHRSTFWNPPLFITQWYNRYKSIGLLTKVGSFVKRSETAKFVDAGVADENSGFTSRAEAN